MTVGFERVEVVVPRRGYDQTAAYPCAAGFGLPAGSGIRIAVEPGGAAVMCDIGLAPEKDQSIGIGIAYSNSEWCIASLKGLPCGCGDIVGSHVISLETRILEVGSTPALTAVIAAIDCFMMRGMESRACIQDIHRQRIPVGREKLPVLGD